MVAKTHLRLAIVAHMCSPPSIPELTGCGKRHLGFGECAILFRAAGHDRRWASGNRIGGKASGARATALQPASSSDGSPLTRVRRAEPRMLLEDELGPVGEFVGRAGLV